MLAFRIAAMLELKAFIKTNVIFIYLCFVIRDAGTNKRAPIQLDGVQKTNKAAEKNKGILCK